MKAADPTYVALIHGVPVRFYESPTEGIDAAPWVAFDDLHHAMRQPDRDLVRLRERLAGNDDTGSVLTDDGPIMIVSDMIASSVTASFVSARKARLSLVQHYSVAFSAAIDALLARLPSKFLCASISGSARALTSATHLGCLTTANLAD